MPETPHKEMGTSRSRKSPLRIVVVVLAVALVGVMGVFLYQYLRGLQQQVVRMQQEVQESREKASEAAEASRAALARAEQSEKSARQSALGKAQAEQARAEAVKEAQQAQQEADAATKQAQLARQETERIRHEREMEVERLQKALGKIAETRRTALGLVMTLGSKSIRFDFDKATLRPENRELLSRIAGVLLTASGFRIQVFGYTDDIGSDEYNLQLSERRAKAVRDYLVKAGVDAGLITTKGFGKSNPLVPGTSPEARAKNRRVEIGIIDSVIGYQGQVAQKIPAR